MIGKNAKKFCCEDISLIENYQNALADDKEIWECHHRLEIHGNIVLSVNDLKNQDLYYNRPAYELIFLSKKDHKQLHANNRTTETKLKAANSNRHKRGKYNISTETHEKMAKLCKERVPHLGYTHSEESRQKMKLRWSIRKQNGYITKSSIKGKKKVWNDGSHTKYHYE